jgi:hypothetical protein
MVVETVLEEVDDLLVGDVDYGGVLVEETPHVLAKGLALFLLHHCQVWLPIRVLLHRSPCASRHQVSCNTSRVVPGAHRVVGPGTHRGSGPREVHTTPTRDPNGIFCGTGRRGLRCAIGHEWPAAQMWGIVYGQDHVWPGVCKAKTLWVLESTARCSVKCPKGAAARDGLAGGEVSRRQDDMPHDEVRGVLLGC